MSATTVHLPDDYDPNATSGTACGLTFGVTPWSVMRDVVITDPEEAGDVTCQGCREAV